MFDAPRHCSCRTEHQLDQLSSCQQEEKRRGLAQACDSGHYQSALQISISNFDINVHWYSKYALASLWVKALVVGTSNKEKITIAGTYLGCCEQWCAMLMSKLDNSVLHCTLIYGKNPKQSASVLDSALTSWCHVMVSSGRWWGYCCCCFNLAIKVWSWMVWCI